PTSAIRSPRISTIWLFKRLPDFGSNNLPARIATTWFCGVRNLRSCDCSGRSSRAVTVTSNRMSFIGGRIGSPLFFMFSGDLYTAFPIVCKEKPRLEYGGSPPKLGGEPFAFCSERRGGSLTNHPVCAVSKVASRNSIDGAATPPNLGGELARLENLARKNKKMTSLCLGV